MKDIILVSHNDLDGLGSSIVAEYVLQNNGFNILDVSNVGNHEVDSAIQEAMFKAINNCNPEGTSIIVTDVTPSAVMAEHVNKLLNKYDKIKLIVLDHHKHALFLNKYHWATIETEREGILTSGSSLVADFLYDQGYDLDYKALEFAEEVRRYDTWDWSRNGWKSPKRLNDLLYLIGHSKFKEVILQSLDAKHAPLVPYEYELLLDVEEERVNRYINKKSKEMKTVDYGFFLDGGKTYKTGVVIVEQYHSELGNKLCEQHDIDLIAMVDISSKKVSLRTIKDDLDVSAIAKAKGGGGHPKASGYPVGNMELGILLHHATNDNQVEGAK